MDMYKEKWTRLQRSVFRLLCVKAGMRMSQREIALLLKASPTAVSHALKHLEKRGFVNIKKEGRMNLLFIELNRDNQYVIAMKRVENLKMLYESGLPVFLRDSFPGTTIILFGSYSRGDDVFHDSEEHRSDIDIAIVGTKGKDAALAEFNNKLGRKIIINFYPSFKEIHKHLRDSILNGIVLSGSVDI